MVERQPQPTAAGEDISDWHAVRLAAGTEGVAASLQESLGGQVITKNGQLVYFLAGPQAMPKTEAPEMPQAVRMVRWLSDNRYSLPVKASLGKTYPRRQEEDNSMLWARTRLRASTPNPLRAEIEVINLQLQRWGMPTVNEGPELQLTTPTLSLEEAREASEVMQRFIGMTVLLSAPQAIRL